MWQDFLGRKSVLATDDPILLKREAIVNTEAFLPLLVGMVANLGPEPAIPLFQNSKCTVR